MVERWKPVPGYEDLYQVSDQGRVRRIGGGKGARVRHILRPGHNHKGYTQVDLYRNNHRRKQTVHGIVAGVFLGPCPAGLEVNHKNGIKDDNRVGNLEYVTQSENMKHSYDVLGRQVVRGAAHGSAKLTVIAVKQIRRSYAKGGVSYRELAEQYGVSKGHISHIVRREVWAHVA